MTGDIIFIVGSGRTGTNFLSHFFSKDDYLKRVEAPLTFKLSIDLAVNKYSNKKYEELLSVYGKLLDSTNRPVIEKSHPLLWVAEKLSKDLIKSKFIIMDRNPYSVVSSMLKHRGSMSWYKKEELFRLGNKFLGIINKEILKDYKLMSPEYKCVLKYLSHHSKGTRLNVLDNFLKIEYEDLILDTDAEISKIEGFIGLRLNGRPGVVNNIYKHKSGLSKTQKREVSKALREFGPVFSSPYEGGCDEEH
jgi:hypothetical protein